MAIKQPWFRERGEFGNDEFYDSLGGGKLDRAALSYFSYPTDIEKSLPNVVLFMFNVIETGDNRPVGTSAAWEFLAGYQRGGLNGAPDIPAKNRTYTSNKQDAQTSYAAGKVADFVGASISSGLSSLAKTYKRVDNAILLPIPDDIQYSVGAGWQEINASSAIGQLANLATAQGMTAGEAAIDGLKTVGIGALQTAIDTGLGQEGAGSALTKSVQNGFQDMAFSGMVRRQFQFSWNLAPRNFEDLDNLDMIVRLFRFQAHPSFNANEAAGNYLQFPGQIDTEWYTKDGEDFIENSWLPKISSSVIESVSTNYTPNNRFSFFKDTGAPTQISLSISIKEVTPLTSTDIGRGF